MEHGLAPGAALTAIRLPCLPHGARILGARGQTQIVTFVTPFDCSACAPHLAAIPELVRRAGAASSAFLVAWAPNPATISRGLDTPAGAGLPVCVDRTGSLWDRYDLLHTPFTVVVRNGVVVYVNDATFPSAASRAEFVEDVRRLKAVPR